MTYEHTPAVAAVIRNCHRLIGDARLLLERGSAGSALSLAILAFEEVGKGTREEWEIQKNKMTPSWHQFRQILAAFNLQISLFQKYDVKPPEFSERIREELKARASDANTFSEIAKKPISADLRKMMVEAVGPTIEHLSDDEAAIAEVEFRWVRKVLEAATKGDVERLRQSGMYVDVEQSKVTSEPAAIDHQQAFRWLFAAERALLILETGNFQAPYSPFAARLESRVGVRPNSAELASFYSSIVERVQAGEDFAEVYLSTLPEEDQAEFRPVMAQLRDMLKAQWEAELSRLQASRP